MFDRSFSIHDALPQKRLKEGNIYLSLSNPIYLFTLLDLKNPIEVQIVRIGINMDMTNLDKYEYSFKQMRNLTRYYHEEINAYKIMGNYANIDPNANLHSWTYVKNFVTRNSNGKYDLFSKQSFHFTFLDKKEMEIVGKYFAGCTIVNNLPKTVVERAIALKISSLCDEYNKTHINKIILGGCHKANLEDHEYQWACEWFNNRGIDTIEKFIEYVKQYTINDIINPMMQIYA